ncbi:MAG: hypothetical protein HKN42_08395 [Granulosicoccus sp.]|nr:hypothetical protein [Granulosicoccus sp.]
MGRNVIFTTYFTGKPDPQSGAKRRRNLFKHLKTWARSRRGGARAELPGLAREDEFERIEVWYDSLLKVGCEAVIFHDRLSEAFTEQWSRPQVQFQHYALKTPRSVNDERYQCYLEYLEAHPDIEGIFMLDLFDIEFFSNPFELFDDARYDIYCGGDAGEYNDKLNRSKMVAAFGDAFYEDRIKLNAGICGGRREPVLELLRTMVAVFDRLSDSGELANLNMAIFNKCVYDLHAPERILYGYPLNSRFKKYERSGNFALRHK